VFAALVDNTLAMETRVNVTFSPALTLEVYVQPLIESDAYSGYREFAAPRQLRKVIYGVDVGTDSVPAGAPQQHWIDPDGPAGPSPKFLITDPSFTFRSLRGNVVLRWEYHPGSTLFLVWTRSGSSQLERGQMDLELRALGEAEHAVIVEVALRHAPAVERDLAVQRRRQAVDNRALHLRLDPGRIDHHTAVHGAHDAVYPDRAVSRHRHFRHLGEK